MITKNGIELTDSEYRERFVVVLNKLKDYYEAEETYEACQECKSMLVQMHNQSTEMIKKTLTTFEVLMKIAEI